MKALVLAGGYATRLRPLSCRKPKLLFPILGKPVLKRNLEVLAGIGVTEVVLAVNYLADILKKSMGRSYAGIKIRYSIEKAALGTGGPINMARRILGDEDTFLAMNGDVLFDEGMKEILEVHTGSGSVATISLRDVEDTSRFGVALVDGGGWIRGFVEKPKPGEVDSRLVNAGFYALSRKIFDYIPSGRRVSTEREVFPVLAQEGKLHSFKYTGYWCDIGKVEDFIDANRRFLCLLPEDGVAVDSEVTFDGDVDLKPPLKICSGSHIGMNSEIGPYTVISEECSVGRGSKVSRSILFEGCSVGDEAEVDGSILGDDVSVGDKSKLMERVVLGTGVSLADGTRIVGGVSVCPYKRLVEDIFEPGNIM